MSHTYPGHLAILVDEADHKRTTTIMTGFARAPEDRPTPQEVYNWKVYVSALIISMGVMAYGYDSAFIGTTITQTSFKRDFGLNEMTASEQNSVNSNLTSICEFISNDASVM